MPRHLKKFLSALIILMASFSYLFVFKTIQQAPPEIEMPNYGINSNNIGLLVKQNDPLSIQTAKLYQKARNIPTENIFYLNLPDKENISPESFKQAYQKLTAQVGDHIQAFAATWQKPYRVDCMSITSALALGFDTKWCQPKKKGCFQTPNSHYFNSLIDKPWTQLKIRPAMLLTGKNISEVKSLIERGLQSDASRPEAAAYLVHTTDKQRSSRWPIFKGFSEIFPPNRLLQIHYVDASNGKQPNAITDKENIMIYQTGLTKVADINSNEYLPGAIADHLTSFGGQGLSKQGQMKAFRWIEAGVTGSYGTVVEPCNFIQKFPNPSVLIPKYLSGQTLIEAYWKSVQQPSEGLFIGDPLAKPYKLLNVSKLGGNIKITTNQVRKNQAYQLQQWNDSEKQFEVVKAQLNSSKIIGAVTIQAKQSYSNRYKVVEFNKQKQANLKDHRD